MKMVEADPSVGREAVNLFEKIIRGKFPKPYREFLLTYNGGTPVPECFLIPGDGSSVIQLFYKINAKETYNDLLNTHRVFKGRIAKELLPIACDPFGNQICIATSGQNFGKVFFWDHEKESSDPDDPKPLTIIAEGFQQLIDSLYALRFDEE